MTKNVTEAKKTPRNCYWFRVLGYETSRLKYVKLRVNLRVTVVWGFPTSFELTFSPQPPFIHPYMVSFKVTVLTVKAWEPCKVNFLVKQYRLLA